VQPGVEAVKAARGSIDLMAQSSVNAALGLVFFMILARLISKEEMGVYAALIASIGLFQTFGVFGLNFAAARFVPKLVGENKTPEVGAAALRIVELTAFFSLAASLVYYFLSPHLSLFLTKSSIHSGMFQLASFVVFTGGVAAVSDALMQGLQEFRKLAFIRVASQAVRILLTVSLLLAGMGLVGVLYGLILLNLILASIPAALYLRRLRFRGSYPLRPVLAFTAPLFGASLLSFLSGYADIFLAMYYLLPGDVGVYNVALTASSSLIMILVASIQAVLLPAFSKAYGQGGEPSVEKAFTKASRYVALIYVPCAIGLAVLSWPVIWLLAGKAYGAAVTPVMILAVSSLGYGLSTPLMVGLQASGRTMPVFKVNIAALAGEAAVCYAAIPFLNVVGASAGRGVLFLVTFFYGVYETQRLMKLRFDCEGLWKSVASAAVMGGVIVLLQLLHTSVFLLPLYLLTGLMVYALCLRTMKGINADDVSIVENLVPERLRQVTHLTFRLLRAV